MCKKKKLLTQSGDSRSHHTHLEELVVSQSGTMSQKALCLHKLKLKHEISTDRE